MTEETRRVVRLSPAARDAAELTYWWAVEHKRVAWTRDPVCRLSVLIQALILAGGTWQDVLDLVELRDDFLDRFLNYWHAATVWRVYVGHYRLHERAVA